MTLRAPDVDREGGGNTLRSVLRDRPVSRAFHTRDIGNRVWLGFLLRVRGRHAGGN